MTVNKAITTSVLVHFENTSKLYFFVRSVFCPPNNKLTTGNSLTI